MGNISKTLRKELERKFNDTYLDVSSQSRIGWRLNENLESARDVLAAISENDTQPFNDFMDAIEVFEKARKAFMNYLTKISNAIHYCKYDEEKRVYKTE